MIWLNVGALSLTKSPSYSRIESGSMILAMRSIASTMLIFRSGSGWLHGSAPMRSTRALLAHQKRSGFRRTMGKRPRPAAHANIGFWIDRRRSALRDRRDLCHRGLLQRAWSFLAQSYAINSTEKYQFLVFSL